MKIPRFDQGVKPIYIIISNMIAFCVIVGVVYINTQNTCPKQQANFMKEEYAGIVVQSEWISKAKGNRNADIKTSTGEIVTVSLYPFSTIKEQVQVGDSLVKIKGSVKLKLVHQKIITEDIYINGRQPCTFY